MMSKIAIIYGPKGGSTERVAEKIAKIAGVRSELIQIDADTIEAVSKYDNIIFGLSTIGKETWNAETVESGWFSFIHDLEGVNMENKKIAIFGLGDQIRYPDNFVDAMGELYRVVTKQGGDTIGKVETSEYNFNDSLAIIDGKFVGLPVDEEFESDLSDRRISSWVKAILPLFG